MQGAHTMGHKAALALSWTIWCASCVRSAAAAVVAEDKAFRSTVKLDWQLVQGPEVNPHTLAHVAEVDATCDARLATTALAEVKDALVAATCAASAAVVAWQVEHPLHTPSHSGPNERPSTAGT